MQDNGFDKKLSIKQWTSVADQKKRSNEPQNQCTLFLSLYSLYFLFLFVYLSAIPIPRREQVSLDWGISDVFTKQKKNRVHVAKIISRDNLSFVPRVTQGGMLNVQFDWLRIVDFVGLVVSMQKFELIENHYSYEQNIFATRIMGRHCSQAESFYIALDKYTSNPIKPFLLPIIQLFGMDGEHTYKMSYLLGLNGTALFPILCHINNHTRSSHERSFHGHI